MGKIGKFVLGLAGITAVVLIGLSLFVRFYLTEERLKEIIIPQAEKSLGRPVDISGIKVGLFSGITVENVVVKEADNKTDFVSVKKFILRYDLMPLLQKKVVVSEIRIVEPRLSIQRDKKGKFNFETLAVLADAAKSSSTTPSPAHEPGLETAALPLALTVNQISIEKAGFKFTDQLGELPEVTAEADINIGLEIGHDLASLRYEGDLKFLVDAVYQELTPHVQGSSHFDQQQITFNVDVDLDNEKAHIQGEVKNYAKAPDIRLDILSKKLDIDHLMALLAGLGAPAAAQGEKKTVAKTPGSPVAPGKLLPPGLKAAGQIKVDESRYKGLSIANFLVRYNLEKGIFTVSDLSARIADGQIQSDLRVDLNQPGLAYDGTFNIDGLQVMSAVAGLTEKEFNQVSGALNTHMTFSGSGIEWPEMKKSLTAEGDYGLFDVLIKKTAVTESVARLLKMDELRELSFEKIDGTLDVKNGQLFLKSTMNGNEVSGLAQGKIGLDGILDLPVTLQFSPELSEKLSQKHAIARYLRDETGRTEIKLKLTGTLDRPRPTIDSSGIQEQATKALSNRAAEELQKLLSNDSKEGEGDEKTDPAIQLLKGLFGK